VEFLSVALLHPNVKHGRQPSTVLRGKTTFDQLHALDGVAVENAEETKQVVHVVDRNAVDQD
jgi:hypothetical protein